MLERLYACGSSSASIYFAMNFIEEVSSPVSSWILRAGYISGLQYGYQAFIWYWGHRILQSISLGGDPALAVHSPFMSLAPFFVAACLISIYFILLYGLPRHYHEKPGSITHVLQVSTPALGSSPLSRFDVRAILLAICTSCGPIMDVLVLFATSPRPCHRTSHRVFHRRFCVHYTNGRDPLSLTRTVGLANIFLCLVVANSPSTGTTLLVRLSHRALVALGSVTISSFWEDITPLLPFPLGSIKSFSVALPWYTRSLSWPGKRTGADVGSATGACPVCI